MQWDICTEMVQGYAGFPSEVFVSPKPNVKENAERGFCLLGLSEMIALC